MKFHIHAHAANGVWGVCCVYDANFSELQARGFLEKLAFMTEPNRSTALWQTGGTLAAQDQFAPTLLQRMEQANSMGKTAMISAKVDEVKAIMHENIELLLDRGDKLEDLEEKATGLAKISQAFHKQARNAKRMTQKELAMQLGCDAKTVQEYESGRAIPNNALIAKMERAMGAKLPRAPRK